MALQKRYAERNVPGSRWQVAQRRAALSQWTCIHTYIYEASQLVWRWLHFNCFSRCNSITAHVCLAAKRFALNARICLWFSTQPHTATGEIPPSPSSPSAHAISSIVQNQTDLGVSARPACAICCVCVCVLAGHNIAQSGLVRSERCAITRTRFGVHGSADAAAAAAAAAADDDAIRASTTSYCYEWNRVSAAVCAHTFPFVQRVRIMNLCNLQRKSCLAPFESQIWYASIGVGNGWISLVFRN